MYILNTGPPQTRRFTYFELELISNSVSIADLPFLLHTRFTAAVKHDQCHVGFLLCYMRNTYLCEKTFKNNEQDFCAKKSFKQLAAIHLSGCHRKLSSVPTKENPLKALLELVLGLNSGVWLTELGTISLVNSGSICWVSAGPLWKMKQF